MAIKVGNLASLKIGANTVAELDSWQLDYGRALEKTHAFGDTWEESTSTIGSFTATGSGRYDPSDTNGHVALQTAALAGTTVACRFYEDATKYYSGSAYVQVSITFTENGVGTVSYSFTGTGALTYV
jgi:hypothetical protein